MRNEEQLIECLKKASSIDPHMRFGQLLVILSDSIPVIKIDDSLLVESANHFVSLREPLSEWKPSAKQTRDLLLKEASSLLTLFPQFRFGQLMVNCAGWAGYERPWFLYDVEDLTLLQGAKSRQGWEVRPNASLWPRYALD